MKQNYCYQSNILWQMSKQTALTHSLTPHASILPSGGRWPAYKLQTHIPLNIPVTQPPHIYSPNTEQTQTEHNVQRITRNLPGCHVTICYSAITSIAHINHNIWQIFDRILLFWTDFWKPKVTELSTSQIRSVIMYNSKIAPSTVSFFLILESIKYTNE